MRPTVVCRDPEIMGGTPVFCGTRVPVQTQLDYLEAGETIDHFLEGFPSVTREQVVAFLLEAKDRLLESVP
jgi:uncharacterized protein (DUF433 family)